MYASRHMKASFPLAGLTALAILLGVISVASSSAAVLITTGKDSSGRAYMEFATPVTFQITTTATVVDFGIIIKNVFSTPPTVDYGVGGGGLFGSVPGSPSVALDYWTSGVTKSDAALVGARGFSFVAGQTFTVASGRFTTTDPVSGSFPLFATGYYDMYLQNAYAPGQVLSANAVPEPSVLGLMAIGLGAFFFRRVYRP